MTSKWDRYRGLLYIIFAVVGFVALVWLSLVLVVRLRGGTLAGGAIRMVDLAVWTLLSIQVCIAR